MTRELGPSDGAPSGEPDITVTFTDEPRPVGPLRLLGLRQAAFDDAHFYLLDGAGHRARLDFSRLGDRCEVVCDRRISHIPLLIPIVGLRLLLKEHVLLHAASFVHHGTGVLVTGWQKGGKTETMLPFMAAGADFVADEWTIVGGREPTLSGVSGVARLWDWHLRQFPQYWPLIRPRARARLRLWRLYRRLYGLAPGLDRLPGRPGRGLRRLSMDGGTDWQGVDQIDPAALFGDRVRRGHVSLDRVFLPVVGQEDRIEILPVAGAEVAKRMVSSLAFERAALTTAYLQFRFAFPDRTSPLIETAREREERVLGRTLADVPAFELRHPYPVALQDLYEAAAPYC
ncbi:hypothetical protein Gobs01_02606 [Geodermatophilus obscurus DSM 43160]|uniref:HPr kinase n=1 Tax=Geodermatophilus obscurus (strain ATCC 25078 / DSM 43160 / JCM 3152 / CCUG 61914 / KCC A-0152 / KCTC 9177 / NBRC 13315 / NRRL B-3577 / G-20) TaxID=526225 RepID=D2S544_GEOOG|nr:HPr kinase [Geodermatophilus obscurus DSM 43160]